MACFFIFLLSFEKVKERVALFENCPWCASKGLSSGLRSYRINLQESITLCTHPQCLFPLVSRPLEDVLAKLLPAKEQIGGKRRNASEAGREDLLVPSLKRSRRGVAQVESTDITVIGSGQCAASETEEAISSQQQDADYQMIDVAAQTRPQGTSEELIGDTAPADSLGLSSAASSTNEVGGRDVLVQAEHALGTNDHILDTSMPKGPLREGSRPCALDSDQRGFSGDGFDADESTVQVDRTVDGETTTTTLFKREVLNAVEPEVSPTTNKINGPVTLNKTPNSETKMAMDVPEGPLTAPPPLFWKNSDNLCWLDALLVALVHCQSLRKCKPTERPRLSPVWELITRYDELSATLRDCQQEGPDGVVKVPKRVLQKANSDLRSVRMSIFKLLQPKLQCPLGERETPVFVLPLLLDTDPWAELSFRLAFHWRFECGQCKSTTNQRVTKTLPTLTNLLPDWHPLHAAHLAPCNVCHKQNQTRTMMLESLPPVLALHFVEGLPNNDLQNYSFNSHGKNYSVTTVIQYNRQLEHFVTWIHEANGSWREFDDLKHPKCDSQATLPVPAQDIHIVFWEMAEDTLPDGCAPSNAVAERPQSLNHFNSSPDKATSPDRSLMLHNDTDIVDALTVSDDDGGNNAVDTTPKAVFDTSIGSTTLLDTFEGLSHSDIVTLTLVEVKPDVKPLDEGQNPDPGLCSTKETAESSPDNSLPAASERTPPKSDSVPVSYATDDKSSGPTSVPGSRRGKRQGQGKAAVDNTSRRRGARARSAKAASQTESLLGSRESTPTALDTAAGDTSPAETMAQALAVSSSEASQPPTPSNRKSSERPESLGQSSRWAFLLNRYSHPQVPSAAAEVAPTQTPTVALTSQIKTVVPNHSTPNPSRKPNRPLGIFPKPQLRRESPEALPLKAAEMYCAFSVKSTNHSTSVHNRPQSQAAQQPAHVAHQDNKSNVFHGTLPVSKKSPINTTYMSQTSLPLPRAVEFLKTEKRSKKSSGHSIKADNLCDTDALRLKLLKKLKAKKKKLETLNQLLGCQGATVREAAPRPDSTELLSPQTVSSSTTYDSSTYDEFFSDLLSPATTASNLSPDSTGFLEMLVNGQEGDEHLERKGDTVTESTKLKDGANDSSTNDNFLEEFISGVAAQQQTEAEADVLCALDLFF